MIENSIRVSIYHIQALHYAPKNILTPSDSAHKHPLWRTFICLTDFQFPHKIWVEPFPKRISVPDGKRNQVIRLSNAKQHISAFSHVLYPIISQSFINHSVVICVSQHNRRDILIVYLFLIICDEVHISSRVPDRQMARRENEQARHTHWLISVEHDQSGWPHVLLLCDLIRSPQSCPFCLIFWNGFHNLIMETFFLFSTIKIPFSNCFLKHRSTLSFVNLRPLTFGHVLIIPERVVAWVWDLTKEEFNDMFEAARMITVKFEEKYGLT